MIFTFRIFIRILFVSFFYVLLHQNVLAQCPVKTTFGSIIPQTNWQTINYGRGGEAQLFVADSGCVYEFSYCVTDGGFAPFDTEITIINNSTLLFAGGYNDDAPGCGLASKVTWAAPANGTYRVQTDRKPCANDTRLVTFAYRKVSCPPPACAPAAMNVCIYDAPGGLGNCNFVGDLCSDGFTFGGDQKNSAPIALPELQHIDSIRFYLYTTGCPPNPVTGFSFYLNNQLIGSAGPGSFDCLCAAVDYPRILTFSGNQIQSAWNACGNNVLSVAAGNDPNYAVSGYRAIMFYTNKPRQVPPIVPLSTLCGSTALTVPPAPCNLQYFWQNAGCDTLRTFPATQQYSSLAPDTIRVRSYNPAIPQCWSDTCTTFVVVAPVANNVLFSDQTICSGSLPALISGALISGGSGTFTYQWESSADSLQWTVLTGATSATFQPPLPLQTVWYRREVFSGCTDVSLPVRISIETPVTGNTIGNDQTLCESQIPMLITGSMVSGGSMPPMYQWLVSGDSIVWNPIPGESAMHFQSGIINAPIWVRRSVQAGTCPPDTSAPVVLFPQPIIGNNGIDAQQTLCSGDTPILLTGSLPSGGTTQYQFQWQSGTDGSNWILIAGGTSSVFQPGNLFTSSYFRRVVQSGLCPPHTSSSLRIQVDAPVGNNVIGNAQTLCEGTSGAPLTGTIPTGGDGQFFYSWESSSDNILWNSIAGASLPQHNWMATLQSRYFRRIVAGGVCNPDTSQVLNMQITPAIHNNFLGSDQTLCSTGSPGILTSVIPLSGGNGLFTYVWQTSINGIAWVSIPGATLSSFIEGTLQSSLYYRRIVQSSICTDTSLAQYWQVFPIITDNIIGNDQTICSGNIPDLLTGPQPQGAGPNPQYQWESSTNQSTWTSIPNATALTYQANALTQNIWFRRILYSQTCVPLTAQPISITVLPALGNNSITPNQTLCGLATPAMITGSNPSGGNGFFQYQWQESVDMLNWFAAQGAFQGQNYAPVAVGYTRYFRRLLLSSSCASDTSAMISIQVEVDIGENTIGNEQTVCAGIAGQTLTGSLPTGGSGMYIYQWQSTTNQSVWTFAGNAQNHPPGSPLQETWYRRIVQAGVCPPNTSLSVKLSVQSALGNNLITDNQVICETDMPALISGSLPSGGNGVYHYEWESSINNLNWLTLPNTFIRDYQPPQVLQSVYYRRLVSSGFCPPISSFPVFIRSDRVIGENSITANQTLCSRTLASQLNGTQPTGGNFSYQYIWQQSPDLINWSNAQGMHVLPLYAPGVLNTSSYFRRVVLSGVCPAITSNSVFLEILPLPGDNVISGAQTICANRSFALLTGSIPTGANGQWTFEWTQSTDGLNWLPAPGNNTGQNYLPQAFSGTRWFRREVFNPYCPGLTSNILSLHADVPISGNIIGSNQTLCAGQTPFILTGDLPTGVLNHLTMFWERSPDSITWFNAADTTLHYQPDPAFNTYFYRRIVYAPICPADTSPVIAVYVQQPLLNNVISADQSLCAGMPSASLTGSIPSGGAGNYIFTWQSSTDTQVWIQCGNTPDFVPGTQSVTTYFRRLLSAGICPKDTSPILTIQIEHPIVNNTIGSEQTLCGGFAPTLLSGSQPSGGIGLYAFQWQSSIGSNNWQNIPAAFQQDYQPPVLMVPTLFRRIVSGGACPVNISSDVLMMVKPKPYVSIQDDSICAGKTIRIIPVADIPGGTFEWSPSGETTPFIEVSPSNTQGYTLQYTFQGCRADAAVALISVVPKPQVTITYAGEDIICVGAAKLLTGNSSQTNVQWLWNTGATTQSLMAPGAGLYTLTVTNSFGCEASESINIRYASPPLSADAPAVSGVCIGEQQQINMIPKGGVPPYEVLWSPAVGLSNPTLFAPVVNITGPATYVATVKDKIGCTASGSVTVGLNSPVSASFYIDRALGDTLYFPDSVRLVNTSLNSLDCTWDLGIENNAHICNPPAFQLLEEGKYTVRLWVVSPEGCRDSTSRDFWFYTQPTISYPNAFSPNGDGLNDIYRIPSLNVTEFGVFIFDRWGNQVFFSDNPKFTWDGTRGGQPLPDGVYIIRVEGQGMHGEPFEYHGSITLIR